MTCRYLLFFISGTLFFSGCRTAPELAPVGDAKWQICSKDIDCMELRGHCNSPHTVNKKFEDTFRKYKRNSEKSVDCSRIAVETWPESYHVSCLDKRCQILELEDDQEADPDQASLYEDDPIFANSQTLPSSKD